MDLPTEALAAFGGGTAAVLAYAIGRFFKWLGRERDRDGNPYEVLHQEHLLKTLDSIASTLQGVGKTQAVQTQILKEQKEISKELVKFIEHTQDEQRDLLKELQREIRDLKQILSKGA